MLSFVLHCRDISPNAVLRPNAQVISWLACGAMILALVGNLYPVPEGPYGKLPYIYLVYLAAGLVWFEVRGRTLSPLLAED